VTIAAFGYPVAFVANAASFLAVVAALFFVRLSPPPAAPSRSGCSLRFGSAPGRRAPSRAVVLR